MTTLHDVLSDLTYGEFSNLNLGHFLPEEFESEPDPKAYAQLTSWLNRSLKEIYSEFLLVSREIYITQDESIATYILSYDYAVTNPASPGQPIRYITDSVASPFLDDVLKIESVYDEEGGELFLNDASEDLSLFTPSYRSLQMPYPNEFNTVAVQYRGSHPKIVYAIASDPSTIEVEIPGSLYQALLFYMAHLAYASMNTDQGSESNDYYRKFMASIQSVQDRGLYIQNEQQNTRFANNGWI